MPLRKNAPSRDENLFLLKNLKVRPEHHARGSGEGKGCSLLDVLPILCEEWQNVRRGKTSNWGQKNKLILKPFLYT